MLLITYSTTFQPSENDEIQSRVNCVLIFLYQGANFSAQFLNYLYHIGPFDKFYTPMISEGPKRQYL